MSLHVEHQVHKIHVFRAHVVLLLLTYLLTVYEIAYNNLVCSVPSS